MRTEWQVTAATVHEGVLDVCATSAAERTPLRFHVPRAILEWAPGQRFFCTVDKTADDDAAHVVMRGTVMRAAAADGALVVSVGGLPMQLPGVAKRVGAAVCIRLTAVTSASVRDRDDTPIDAPAAAQQPRRSQRPRRR